MGSEHDDDLAPTVDTHGDVETDDFPTTSDDFEQPAEEEDGKEVDPRDDDASIVGK